MQDDIKPPVPKKRPTKAASSPKTTGPKKKPEAEEEIKNLDEPIVIDEEELEDESKKKTVDKTETKESRFAWLHFKSNYWDHWSKRRKIITSAVSALVVVGIALGLFFGLSHKPQIPNAETAKKEPSKTTVASPLTGVQVNPLLAKRPVTAIMIENSDEARPQSGLQDAGVVYEAIAEAGITRFMAFYQESTPQYIGPVRSLRPYYIDFAAPFQASIVHVGGSPDALSEVSNGSYRNLDQFYNGSYFTRITARDAPHNVYTSFNQLDQLNQSKGYITSQFTPWPRKADKKMTTPSAKTIDLSISSADFSVHYDYDAASNSYARSEGGAPHMDLVSSSDTVGVQLKPKVVIALVMSQSLGALDSSGAYYTDYTDYGTGTAYVFQDGGVTQGTWTKASTTDQFKFADSAGNTIKLNAGQTWISLVGSAGDVSYAP